jgi:prolyl-tRNA synthetase
MTHGDDKGLVLPPRVAPIQVVIIPIVKETADNEAIVVAARELAQGLVSQGIRVMLDESTHKTPGAKFYHWEMRGVPVRIEIGPRDLAQQQAVLVDRLTGTKQTMLLADIPQSIVPKLAQLQQDMFERARKHTKSIWYKQAKLVDFAKQLEEKSGFYQAGWCGKPACEQKLKEHRASIRCLLGERTCSTCFNCDEKSETDILIAKSY